MPSFSQSALTPPNMACPKVSFVCMTTVVFGAKPPLRGSSLICCTALVTSWRASVKLRNTCVKPCSVICGAEPMFTTSGTLAASAACAAEMVAPESQAPTSTLTPSRIRRSAATRPFSGLDSVSTKLTSIFTPSSAIIFTPSSVPRRVCWPGKESTPESGRMTPTLSGPACARRTEGKPSAAAAVPAASRPRRLWLMLFMVPFLWWTG